MTDFSREYRKKHLSNQLAIADRLKAAMVRVGDKAARIVSDPQAKFVKSFDFRNNPHLNKIITGLITEFQGDALKIIETGIVTSWAISNEKNDRMVQNYIQNLSILKKQEATYLNTNQDALKSFIAQKKQGKTLSERVWQSAEKFRDELEVHLGYGIANGDSAAVVSRRIRDYLINPEALFRRVRDEAGKLQLSTAAKQFHPGQGIYRSAYKNAFRVARSETNRAYLYSDHLRWQKQDFVIGVNVELSEQHPTPDICDHMQGDYPKGYVFTGWHPACLCHATPILMPREKFKKYLKGEDVEVDAVVDVPQGYNEWIDQNKDRVKGWKTKPYFIQDNYKNGDLNKGLKFKQRKSTGTEPPLVPA